MIQQLNNILEKDSKKAFLPRKTRRILRETVSYISQLEEIKEQYTFVAKWLLDNSELYVHNPQNINEVFLSIKELMNE